MTKTRRVCSPAVTFVSVAIVGAMLASCGSTKSGGAADASRDAAGGATSASGLVGAGGREEGGAGAGGTAAGGTGVGGTVAGGTGGADAGLCPPGQVWCPGCTPGSGSCGQICAGPVCPELDASPNDVPLSLDLGSGGTGSGGRTVATGGAGAGGTGGGGVTGSGGNGGGSGGAGGTACTRVSGYDASCRDQSYPPLAYFCPVPAQPPATACVIYSGINSGDYYCCPDPSVSCPDSPPTDAAACTGSLTCRYGTHPALSCRTRATCANGTWQVSSPPPSCSDPLPPAGCPGTPVSGGDCSPEGVECYYATGDYCMCAQCTREYPSCIFTDPIVWHCLVPPGGGCPPYYPNLGSACALPANTQCRYRCDLIAICSTEGAWVDGGEKCPICNSPDTPIATPAGNRPIASLVPGDLVYSIHRGQVSIVPIAEVGRQRAQRDHHVMRLLLATGTVIEISPRHPTADGRTMGDLAADDLLDGVRLVSVTLVPYRHSHTYDILPASDTGTYYASGVLIGSTMASGPRLASAPAPACSMDLPDRRQR
jgi:hypothetical protein